MNIAEIGRTLAYETIKYCKKNGPTVQLSEVYHYLEINVAPKLPGIEKYKDSYAGHSDPKWLTQLKFTLIDFDKAGWFKKSFPKRGYWTVTEDGLKAFKQFKDGDSLAREANKRYKNWLANQQKPATQTIKLPFIGPDSTTVEKPIQSVEEIIEEADLKIKARINEFDPYELQDLVGQLLTAMGYFVDFIAPKGKDGGIDLVCYQDPMGIKAPRMKVQVKHRPTEAVSRPTLSEFADQIKHDEVGIFVTTGTFSRDSRQHAIGHDKHIRLIDGVEFVDLLKQHYIKLDQATKELIPLVEVFHLNR